ncbi:MAG: hypothetical protein ABFS14_10895 [Gemmatimonadota bacterium]
MRTERSRKSSNSRWGLAMCVLLLAGCAGAQKRYEQGVELENAGRYAEAAARYIQSLEKEPNQPDVRDRLRNVGGLAIQGYLEDSRVSHESGYAVSAAQQFLVADRLLAEASGVGVLLPTADDYALLRGSRFEDAVTQLLDTGDSALAEGRWGEAVGAFAQVEGFEPTYDQLEAARTSHAEGLIGWGHEEMLAGHFRAAVQRSDEALALLAGQDSPHIAQALDLRAQAVEGGTVWVAFTPILDLTTAEAPSSDFAEELNDVLELDHWSHAPLMVASADPILIRRELRRNGRRRSALTDHEAARIGRSVGVDLVLVGELDEFESLESNVRERPRAVKTRDGSDATFTEIEGSLRMEVGLEFALVDAHSRRRVGGGHVRASAKGDFERGEFDGDVRDLQLSRGQRRLFEDDWLADQYAAVEDELVAKLAVKVAREAYQDISRTVP